MAGQRLRNCLRCVYLIAILNCLWLLLGLNDALSLTDHTGQGTRTLIFTVDEQVVELEATDIEAVDIGISHKLSEAYIEITLTPQATQAIVTLTAANIGKRMRVSWDNKVITEELIEKPLVRKVCLIEVSPVVAEDFVQWVNQGKRGIAS